jgi:hypothetical protein
MTKYSVLWRLSTDSIRSTEYVGQCSLDYASIEWKQMTKYSVLWRLSTDFIRSTEYVAQKFAGLRIDRMERNDEVLRTLEIEY